MKSKWLVEVDLFTDTEEDLIKAIKDSGREVKTLKYIPFDDDLPSRCLQLYGPEDCVVFYGSLNFCKKLRKLPWIPGVYLDDKKYECTSYYPAFGDLLVHKDYLMMPYGDLLRRKDELYDIFNKGHAGHIFIRPNSGLKEFTGTVLPYHEFEDGIKICGFYDVEPELLVVVSDAKQLTKEWRFVIVNQEVISGSLYRDWSYPEKITPGTTTKDYILMKSHSVKELCTDDKAIEFAKKCAKMYNPEPVWTLDIAEMYPGTFGVLEAGCFSGAGMYGNNLKKIVELVSAVAENEWNEYTGNI